MGKEWLIECGERPASALAGIHTYSQEAIVAAWNRDQWNGVQQTTQVASTVCPDRQQSRSFLLLFFCAQTCLWLSFNR
jgi:DMSO reductase anchor subunit